MRPRDRYTTLIFSPRLWLFFFTFAKTKERVLPPARPEGDFLTDPLRTCFGTGHGWFSFWPFSLYAAVRGGSIIYFFKYVVRDESKFTLYATTGSVAFIAGAFCTNTF